MSDAGTRRRVVIVKDDMTGRIVIVEDIMTDMTACEGCNDGGARMSVSSPLTHARGDALPKLSPSTQTRQATKLKENAYSSCRPTFVSSNK